MATKVSQGTLNLIRSSLVVPSYTNLSITPEYMDKEMLGIQFDDDGTLQYDTATGIVNSPQPYVKATVTCTILKTQGLSALWFEQFQSQTVLGTVIVHPDDDPSTGWPVIRVHSTALLRPQPGKFNGTDPGVVLTMTGKVNANSSLFSF